MKHRTPRSAARGAFLGMLVLARSALAQQQPAPITATPDWDVNRFHTSRASLSLTLSRPPVPQARIAVMVGSLDVSALVRAAGSRVTYRPAASALPAGEHELIAYEVEGDSTWREIGRYSLKILTARGFTRTAATPQLDLASAGQLDQGVPDGSPAPDRLRYQDATATAALETRLERPGASFVTSARLIAASEPRQRLRWSSRQTRAPAADLAEYRISISRGAANFNAGHIALGSSRQLINGFSSRGVGAQLPLARGVTLRAGAAESTPQVGWDHVLGVTRSDHRLATASLDWEAVPSRPGTFSISLAKLRAAAMPFAGFAQGTVNDAESSHGEALTLSLAHPGQRARLSAGVARSRFVNPNDPSLARDTAIVPVRAERRLARFADGTLQLLSGVRLASRLPVTLAVGGRWERVDPLYRSIGAPLQADQDRRALDLSASVGGVAVQAAATTVRDNLDRVASVLTTRTRTRGVSASAPLATALGLRAAFLPAVSVSWLRTDQLGDGVPVNSGFAASSVPNQTSESPSWSAAWQFGGWGVTYRGNRAWQDNRQPGRERADFTSRTDALGISAAPHPRLSLGLDASTEWQHNHESGTRSRTRQVSSNGQFLITTLTAVQASYAPSRMRDGFAGTRRRGSTGSVELSQGLALYRRVEGGSQGRAFIRYQWSTATVGSGFQLPTQRALESWTLATGLSFRLY
jgi:hypothetical protein